ncbi:glycosyltransferase family 4 protein [Arcicella sp. DC2W]|uniref:Glycosyltransferase family 4 protein n=1 Tax=Arcicella gelida TaxID=2984195 RepID=A0ABU5S1R6_9BACT|nr:glycosyltransferase family 4 protein [Arcicella sp. DC2W]MEA5402354.1 glycosyltransferase family 4 protein [Arcicella sp. DC2W]
MKILVLSFNFQPDLCAGSFRSTALVKALQAKITSTDSIEVLTTTPNRYHSFSNQAPVFEQKNNLIIRRIPLPAHKNSIFGQIFAFIFYAKSVLRYTQKYEYTLIYASSSRLFTAFLGAIIARRKPTLLFLDIRDIFAEAVLEAFQNPVLKFFMKVFLVPILKIIEKFSVNTAQHLNLVSEAFADNFKYFKGNVSYFTNGIDEVFLAHNFEHIPQNQPQIITYAGNIGNGQGLEKIIPATAKALEGDYIFNIIGDGNTKTLLAEKLRLLNVKNVNLFKPVSQEKLIEFYQKSDFLFLHLNDAKAFEKVLPSKIFEYGASNKTIIAGVNGFARNFIEKNVANVILFKPCDSENLVRKLENYRSEEVNRSDFIEKFSRKILMDEMAKIILAMIHSPNIEKNVV